MEFDGILKVVAERRSIDWRVIVTDMYGGGFDDISKGFPTIIELIDKKLLEGWEDQDRDKVGDAMKKHLLQIDAAQLSQEWRRSKCWRAYEIAFNQLTEAGKNAVTEQLKTTKKKRVEDFMEKRS